ncbi:MAG: archaetidylserine decarboxylase [Gammaproteobacteria bacterium]
MNAAGDRLRNLPQYLLPQRLSTRIAYRLTRSRKLWLKDRLIRAFIARFDVDMSEALEPDPGAYAHFNAFFTRALKPDARPLAAGEDVLCCPVDGAVSQAGVLTGDTVLQAKGRCYSLTALLGGDAARAAPFRDGRFATLYLAPRDYHRIHMPIAGRLREMVHVPGRLFSVSPLTTRMVPNLFARNERVAALFDTALGPLALVMVGAINVASIETVWAGVVTPPLGRQIRAWRYPASGADAVALARGAEMGRFNMGSTVIVLAANPALHWDAAIQPGARVRMGQTLGAS